MKLKRFVINDLFGFQTVDIPFDKNIKILIGENGLGKTTVLNTLYFVLNKKFERLAKVSFSSIELYKDSKKKIVINKSELLNYLNRNNEKGRSHFSELLDKAGSDQIKNLKDIIEDPKLPIQHKRLQTSTALKSMGININAPTTYIYDLIRKYLDEIDANNFLTALNELDLFTDFKILYFPTFRRVEEELKNIGIVSRKEVLEKYGHFMPFEEDFVKNPLDEDIIQFGMGDVDERINKLTKEIAQSSVVGFSEITGEMLHQLLTEFPEAKTAKGTQLEINKIKIILQRVGPNISDEDKTKIIEFIESGKTTNRGLIYFINKLIELYNKQEDLDTSIKNFATVCNGYLNGKQYVYDEREVTLKIKRAKSGEEVLLNQLSSGEKQIVSLFSKIYLEKENNYIVLFDEPELSLSIFWQQKLLPDIVNSERCKFLVAVTHSPFIYDNELSSYAVGLNEYIKFK
jgi:predicted ATPase